MFWGTILEPEKRYSQVVKRPFHLSHAALDVSTGDGSPCQVLLRTGGGNFIICSLQKGKDTQTPLNLYFQPGSDITFSTNGKCSVHITGYQETSSDDEDDEEETDLDETVQSEAEAENNRKKKRKMNSSPEESRNNKKSKEEKKFAQNTNLKIKKPSTAGAGDGDSDSSDEEVDLQDLLDGDDVDSDEQDNSYQPNDSAISGEGDSAEDNSDEDDEEDDDEDDDDDEESDTEAPTTKKLGKKDKTPEVKPQLNGIDKKNKENQQQLQKQQKKQKNKEEKKQQNEKPQQPQREKRTLSGGVHIEDLKVGNGPQVVSGKSVQVYYEGRLQSNNKMFDKHLNGPGFKFRAGSQEVIRGWDVGIMGMRAGGKRKIVCPPNMAYGPKGSPPVIPPNSTLVFEVELKRINN